MGEGGTSGNTKEGGWGGPSRKGRAGRDKEGDRGRYCAC